MTLTFPVLNAARNLLWLITGENKATVLNKFFQGDTSLLASQINRERAIVFADEPALSKNPLVAHVDGEQ
jgi:6-phosphogluconolactonase